jgi:hypothetical protein
MTFVDEQLVNRGVTDQIVNVMSSDSKVIEACEHRGYVRGRLQLSRLLW